MQKTLKRWEILCFFLTGLLGVIGHFLFKWCGSSAIVGAFSAVNESTWEHMKLLFIPVFLLTMAEFFIFSLPDFFAAKCFSLLMGLLTIPTVFYTLQGMFGKTPDVVNITIFFLADAVTYLFSAALLSRRAMRGGTRQFLSFVLLWLLLFAFVFFTFRPPHLPLFQDPVTLSYGIP